MNLRRSEPTTYRFLMRDTQWVDGEGYITYDVYVRNDGALVRRRVHFDND